MRWLKRHADEAGLLAFVIVALVAVGIAAAAYFGGPEAKDQIDGGPSIPLHDAESARGTGMQRGAEVGAAADKTLPRPASYLQDHGFAYKFYGSPNWSSRGIGDSIEAVVVHVASGSCAGMRSWFNNPSSQVSAHFGVCRDGHVEQYVELGDAAWHAGVCIKWTSLADRWCGAGINPNRRTVGIELELSVGDRLDEYPQMKAALEALLSWVLDTAGLDATHETIIGHYDIDSVNRSVDPKCCLELASVIADLRGGGVEEPVVATEPRWNGVAWVMPDGWQYRPSDGAWLSPAGVEWWSGCTGWKGRQHLPTGVYVHQGTPLFYGGFWATAPNC